MFVHHFLSVITIIKIIFNNHHSKCEIYLNISMISTDLIHEVSRDTKAKHDDLDPEGDVCFQLGRQTRVSRETSAVAATRDGMCSPTKRKREKSRERGEGKDNTRDMA